jgi:adenylate cyclase
MPKSLPVEDNEMSESAFDVVLLDVMMPELDGIEVLAQMKADPQASPLRVDDDLSCRRPRSSRALHRARAEDYLPKSITALLPRARISACLDRKRLHDREAGHLAEIEVQRRHADELLHGASARGGNGRAKGARQ